ncbi:helix-turn-helix domain-containing protein [Paucibacter sp. AS339]|uniref:GlxA family transcriptional regulator n=1 Tax=Paucibacter hankyongi TaxID=3133434 RepID=UPI0030ACAC47
MTAKTAKAKLERAGEPQAPKTIVLVIYEGCQSLDVTGPWEVFSKANTYCQEAGRPAPYRLLLASPDGGPITSNSGLQLGPTTALAALRGAIDTVLVVGGNDVLLEQPGSVPKLVPWLQRRVGQVRRMGSVCTGAFALAAAGLLDGRRATTHWQYCERLAALYPQVMLEPDAIFVADPPLFSSAGITAAIDLSLALVEADQGQALALQVARNLVLFLRRPGGQSQYSAGLQAQAQAGRGAFSGPKGKRLAELLLWMVEHPAQDLGIAALAARAHMSERHFARLFMSETGQTPARFVEALRLERAKTHLEQSAWPLARVAQKAGFGSVDSLQRSLKRQAGISPEQYRQRFSRQSG